MENQLKTEKCPYHSRLKRPIVINCNIRDTLTPTSCTKIVTDIAKYILCNKLIPYPYDMLKSATQNLNSLSVEEPAHPQRRKYVQMKQHHKKMVEAYKNCEIIFKNIQLELQNCAACDDAVEEVVLLIGATSRSPREVYRIIVPPVSCIIPDQKQHEGRISVNLIRSIVLSEDIQDMLNQTVSPTNMYVMLKKRQGRQSDWFFPKDSYSLPSCGRQAIIILHEKVVVYVDSDPVYKTTETELADTPVDAETQQNPLLEFDNLHIVPKCTQWFQSPVCVKGFKRCRNDLTGLQLVYLCSGLYTDNSTSCFAAGDDVLVWQK